MKILVDENIPKSTVETLKGFGHDVLDIRGSKDEGISDRELWGMALKQHRMLISTDRGFTQRRHEKHHGILIIALRQPNCSKIHDRIITALNTFPSDQWRNLLVIMRDQAKSTWRP